MKFLSFLRTTSLWILLLPVALTFTGAASNQAVIIANHDTFPVLINNKKLAEMTAPDTEPEAAPKSIEQMFRPEPAIKEDDTVMLDDVHCNMTHQTHLNFLADVFDMKDGTYSIGDFFLILGSWIQAFSLFVYVYAVTAKLRKLQS